MGLPGYADSAMAATSSDAVWSDGPPRRSLPLGPGEMQEVLTEYRQALVGAGEQREASQMRSEDRTLDDLAAGRRPTADDRRGED